MCGIAGFVRIQSAAEPRQPEGWASRLQGMGDRIAHRGPDDHDIWFDPAAGVGLAHRRLAILDLSPRGHQPMATPDGRLRIVYNGEIYNFPQLREELEGQGVTFSGRSDTEVFLAAIQEWGLERALERANGMFAFALWDRDRRCLHLARDRAGEKPLYYGRIGGLFAFASELKALRSLPEFDRPVDRDSLTLLLRYGYITAPHSIYQGIYKLPPGEVLSLELPSSARGGAGEPRIRKYWDAAKVAERGLADPLHLSDTEATDELHRLLRDAVERRMISDVPLGAFLSGGIDSSTIVALMQEVSGNPVRTFTIGFDEERFNEAPYAKAVADHLQTDHLELYLSGKEALEIIPRLPTLFDEPFADSSQIPTFLVSELARRHVTVCLTGDAGDELFCGYGRYLLGRKIWRIIDKIPYPLRRAMAAVLEGSPAPLLERSLRWMAPVIRRYGQVGGTADKLKKLADVLRVRTPAAFYQQLVSLWKEPAELVIGAREPRTPLDTLSAEPELHGLPRLHRLEDIMMFLDLVTYLPGDILTKVDRTSMAVSLETRIPFLDPEIIDFAWRLPMEQKVRDGKGKWLLRQVLDRYVPSPLVDRRKQGFGIPLQQWLLGPLQEWAGDLLAPERLMREGFFVPELVQERWQAHLRGERDWHAPLWAMLVFQQWLESERSSTMAADPPVIHQSVTEAAFV